MRVRSLQTAVHIYKGMHFTLNGIFVSIPAIAVEWLLLPAVQEERESNKKTHCYNE